MPGGTAKVLWWLSDRGVSSNGSPRRLLCSVSGWLQDLKQSRTEREEYLFAKAKAIFLVQQ